MSKKPLRSDQIDLRSPMSMSGFTSRFLRVTHADFFLGKALLFLPRVVGLALGWTVLLVWNILVWGVFFWFTLIWRHYRNAGRRDKRNQAQHEELMDALYHRH